MGRCKTVKGKGRERTLMQCAALDCSRTAAGLGNDRYRGLILACEAHAAPGDPYIRWQTSGAVKMLLGHCARDGATGRYTGPVAAEPLIARLACGHLVYLRSVEAARNENRACTRACRRAYGLKCECACGGEEHGAEISDHVRWQIASER